MKNYIVSRITDQSCLKGQRFPCRINSESNMIAINVGNGSALLIKPNDPDYIYILGDDNIPVKELLKKLAPDTNCKIKCHKTSDKIFTGPASEALSSNGDFLAHRIKKVNISTTPKGKKSLEIRVEPSIINENIAIADVIEMISSDTIIKIKYESGQNCFLGPAVKITEQSEIYGYPIIDLRISEHPECSFEITIVNPPEID